MTDTSKERLLAVHCYQLVGWWDQCEDDEGFDHQELADRINAIRDVLTEEEV